MTPEAYSTYVEDGNRRATTQSDEDGSSKPKKSSYKGHTADALASRVEEGRDKLRKAVGSRK
ncbi:hypothetical protein TAMA11512_19290 [Selenomonas sp. TAMA-11512]|nr:hypothetical protein TAMA11512_19290 [Selenomonas sp. TAMA-11512]